MRIGVYVVDFPPEAGGGYTFQQEILASLEGVAPESRHRFTVFLDGVTQANARHYVTTGNLETVLLEPQENRSRISTLVRKVGRKLGWKLNLNSESPFQKAAHRENIQFVWFPTPVFSPAEIPYIATMWDIQHRLQPWFPEVGNRRVWNHRESYYPNYFRRATYVVTGSKEGCKELSFFCQVPLDRFRILPLPAPKFDRLPSEEKVAAVLANYGISRDYLFYPSQFWPHKNHANLLLGLKILRDKHRLTIPLVLTGSDQGNRRYIENLVSQLGLIDQVHLLGFVPKEDMITLYVGAFALTDVTFFGPDNLPPLEAFACGCPVIASNVPGVEEQLGAAAILIDPRKPEEIAEAVIRLRTNPEFRQSLIARGHARAAQFTGAEYVRGIFALLDEFEPIRRNWK